MSESWSGILVAFLCVCNHVYSFARCSERRLGLGGTALSDPSLQCHPPPSSVRCPGRTDTRPPNTNAPSRAVPSLSPTAGLAPWSAQWVVASDIRRLMTMNHNKDATCGRRPLPFLSAASSRSRGGTGGGRAKVGLGDRSWRGSMGDGVGVFVVAADRMVAVVLGSYDAS
jgi:hypothetical protein